MTGNWILLPPWTNEQGPINISRGSLIRKDFDVVKQNSEFEILTSLCWTKLSRQDVANLRNLASSEGLKQLVGSYHYGISTGIEIDMVSDEDPNNAEFGLMLSSEQEIPTLTINEIVDFVKQYRVH